MASEFEHERAFPLFGTRVRLLLGEPVAAGAPHPEVVLLQIEGFLRGIHRRLTRFEADSELSALNAAPDREVRVSGLMAAAVEAALWAARRSGGLVDPTVIDALERAGYRRSRRDDTPAPLAEALAAAPRRRSARPALGSRWGSVGLDAERLVVRRPPGVRLDVGGIGKGLAADLASARLGGYSSHVVDVGGDIRIDGEAPRARSVRIAHPAREGVAHELTLTRGAVATSGISRRLWKRRDGYAHHLIDPGNGQPSWTGLLQVSALAPTALEAETLAKMAYLSGSGAAAGILAEHGGLTVAEDGSVRSFGPLDASRDRVAEVAA